MTQPEVVVFDLGKVLLDFDFAHAARRIAALGRLTPQETLRFFETSPWLVQYETGLINREEFFGHTRQATGFTGTLEQFSRFFADIFTPIDPMLWLHQQLRACGRPTYIFSNTNDLAIEHIRINFPFFHQFDDFILSYEHHAMKPHPRLYEVVEEKSRCLGRQIFYIDDRAENVQAGADRGWVVFLQQSPDQTWQQVRRLGLL